jgi:hypothetical protein
MMANRNFKTYLLLCLVLISAIYFKVLTTVSQPEFKNDFQVFYGSAKLFLSGEKIYSPIPGDLFGEGPDETLPHGGRTALYPNLNPPAFSLILTPLAQLDYPLASISWFILSLSCGILSIYLIVRALYEKHKTWIFLSLTVLLFAYYPTFSSLLLGQLSMVLLFLIIAAWYNARLERDLLAGLFLGVALALKLFTGLFLIIFLIQRRWRLLLWYAATYLATTVSALIITGKENFFDYLANLRNINWYEAIWNGSSMGYFTRIFNGYPQFAFFSTIDPGRLFSVIFSLAIFAFIIYAIWPRKETIHKDKFDLDFSLAIVAMLLISPLGWMYYFSILVLPIIVIWNSIQESNMLRIRYWVVVAWLLSTIPSVQNYFINLDPLSSLTIGGVYFYALINFLLIFSVILYFKIKNPPEKEHKFSKNQELLLNN